MRTQIYAKDRKTAQARYQAFMAAPDVHDWAKTVLQMAWTVDVVDALNAVDVILDILEQKNAEIQAEHGGE